MLEQTLFQVIIGFESSSDRDRGSTLAAGRAAGRRTPGGTPCRRRWVRWH